MNSCGRAQILEFRSVRPLTYLFDHPVVSGPDPTRAYFAYNDRGQTTRIWGHVPQPVEYLFDAEFGVHTGMRTWQTAPGEDNDDWTTPEWPGSPPGVVLETTWARP